MPPTAAAPTWLTHFLPRALSTGRISPRILRAMAAKFLALSAATAALAAAPEQINLHPTARRGVLSVDFVSTAADGSVSYSYNNGPFVTVNSTSFEYDTIGYMHQATLDLSDVPVGAPALYRVATSAGASATFSITPQVAVPKYAVYGDFGLVNDESMDDIIKYAHNDAFDTVLHVGDWAYDFEDLFSVTGNAFMNLAQGYQSIKPVAVAEGNHEACTICSPVPAFAGENGRGYNFTQCVHNAPTAREYGTRAQTRPPTQLPLPLPIITQQVQGALPQRLAQLQLGQQPLLLV